jgi:hypothetical protein
MHAIFGQPTTRSEQRSSSDVEADETWLTTTSAHSAPENPSADLARCYLRLADQPSFLLERLNRYEAALRRQVAQTLFALNVLDRRKPHERKSYFDPLDPN